MTTTLLHGRSARDGEHGTCGWSAAAGSRPAAAPVALCLLQSRPAALWACRWPTWSRRHRPPPLPADSSSSCRADAPAAPDPAKAAPSRSKHAEPAGRRPRAVPQGRLRQGRGHLSRHRREQEEPVPVAEEARFYEAECLRLPATIYPEPADTYHKVCSTTSPRAPTANRPMQHMFDIANYWLDDTRTGNASKSGRRRERQPLVRLAALRPLGQDQAVPRRGRPGPREALSRSATTT